MLGFGRFGGIAGSFLVAELTGLEMSFAQIFTVVAIASLASAAAILVKELAYRSVRRAADGSPANEVAAH
jgi:AAHS family 4-hydroxybenzoate transporter-like MFS transporter